MEWSRAPERREEIVLFPTMLDEAIPVNHPVRLFSAILDRVDWAPWEAKYKLTKGMPPIHPKVLASVVLFGLLMRIRTSRGLEDALEVRMDFRWLAEGRSIDHTTISKFRQHNTEALKDLFVQVGLIAREMGHLPLQQLGYDGTKIRASNRRTGTRTLDELLETKKTLEEQFQDRLQLAEQSELQEEEAFGRANQLDADPSAKSLQEQLAKVSQAIQEIEEIEAQGKQIPDRLPITDPSCRITKNKEGGFAPNHTPTITVDIESGLIVDCDVISGTDEQNYMVEAVERVRENFLDEQEQPIQCLADGLMATGDNISQCAEKNIELFTPSGPVNPAHREDPSQPLTAEQADRLPLRGKAPQKGEEDTRKFDKAAFVYDAEKDQYWCPNGKVLVRYSTTSDHRGDVRYAYRIPDKETCAGCAFRNRCYTDSTGKYGRRIESGEHEREKQQHAAKMQSSTSKETYKKRAPATERPFATIKHGFAARSFLTRGIGKVRNEWRWLTIACNLKRLMHLELIRSGAP
jgi:transposase